jgi:hypothetical protein
VKTEAKSRSKSRAFGLLAIGLAFLFAVQSFSYLTNLQSVNFSNASNSGNFTLSLLSPQQPTANSLVISAPQGSSRTVGVVVNNSLSSVSWIVERLTFSNVSSSSISLQSSGLLLYITTIPNNSVSTPLSITAKVTKNSTLGTYAALGLLQLRTSLLPPFETVSLTFNVTIVVIPPPPPSMSLRVLVIDSAILMVDAVIAIVLLDIFIRRPLL